MQTPEQRKAYYQKLVSEGGENFHKERYKNLKERLGTEGFKVHNRNRQEIYRREHGESYRNYQANYHRKYLKNPANRLIHKVRTKLTALFDYYSQRKVMAGQRLQNQKDLLGTTYIEIGEFLTKRGYFREGKVINHIIPLSYLVSEYKIKNLHILFDIVNMEVINKDENLKLYNYVNDPRQIEIAKILEAKYPEQCHGLAKNVELKVKENGGK